MTLVWFVVWLVANNWGDHAPLHSDPVNIWTGTLLLAIALDLSRQHAPDLGRPARAQRSEWSTPGRAEE